MKYASDSLTRKPQDTLMWLIIAVLTPLFLSGCSDSGTGGMNGNGIGTEPTFENVQAILSQSCGGSNCHIGNSQSGVRLDSYNNVINSTGSQYGTEIVQPGNADESPLVDKIEPNPDFGNRMPLNGPPYLTTDRINQIKEWIAQGAENN